MAAVLRLVQLLALLCSLVLAAPTSGPAFPVDDPWYVPPEGFESTAPGTILRSRTPPYPMAAFGVASLLCEPSTRLLGVPLPVDRTASGVVAGFCALRA